MKGIWESQRKERRGEERLVHIVREQEGEGLSDGQIM